MILPSIDLMDGKAVQLQQGKTKILEREDVMALAEEFSRYGDLAVIDLDAARSINGDGSERKDSNRELVKTLCRRYPCRVGGGIRTRADAQELLAAGARKLIIGTAAEPGLLCTLPRERIIVALDALQGKVTSNGWQRIIEESVSARAQRLEQYCSGFLYTCIEREGMLQGPDLQTARMLARQTINRIGRRRHQHGSGRARHRRRRHGLPAGHGHLHGCTVACRRIHQRAAIPASKG
ncbi:MAG: 1-(5-phosphoribosyl)-5-[(5-phosphoribosylamino)methylideneamino] imidazole-4-carboxamide isomerase [Flavobacteriales bacterium CG_4_10_14_0_2_um_filter_32_8]|nr:MAG: 1-(5-phosphoribosyl)-5-[(5-phosphoribosylamino)methylideneamino] imidazole-4-carboxamide isomerase [Flavobacteriales bacterium CG_4_10_14_0_2_um_filter_32_8]